MRSVLLCFVFGVTSWAATAPTTGSVTGSVLDANGKPISGAVRVFLSQALPAGAIRHAAPPVQTGPQVTSRLADKAGNFRIEMLALGDYVACASTATPGFLDPCQWAAVAPAFTVSTGQITSGVKIVMAKGAVIPIRVNDAPQKLLKAQENSHDLEFQIHAVTASGRHHTALIGLQDAAGRDQSITVPFGTPVTLQVFSPKLAISEATGKLAAPGGLTVIVPAGTAAAQIVLSVTGGK